MAGVTHAHELSILGAYIYVMFTIKLLEGKSKFDSYKEIQKIDEISSTPVGHQYVVVLTIYVDGNMSTFKSHELADQLELSVSGLDKIYRAIVHVEPI